uniref:Uncharacterized protein n=1 Tax=Ditylenchus dipsaci TaxID=166011 RepID=A0A915D3I9_9BILA
MKKIHIKFGANSRITKVTNPEAVLTILCDFDKISCVFKELLPVITKHQPFEATELRLLFHRVHCHFLMGLKGKNVILLGNVFNSLILTHSIDCPQSTERVIILSGSQEDMVPLVAQIAVYLKDEIPPMNKYQARKMYDPAVLQNCKISPSVYGGYGKESEISKVKQTVHLSIPNWLARAHLHNEFTEISRCRYLLNTQTRVKVGEGSDQEENSSLKIVGSPHRIQAAVVLIKKSLRRTKVGCEYLAEVYKQRAKTLTMNSNRKWWEEKARQINRTEQDDQHLLNNSAETPEPQHLYPDTDCQQRLICENFTSQKTISWSDPKKLKSFCDFYELKANIMEEAEQLLESEAVFCPYQIQQVSGARVLMRRAESKDGKGNFIVTIQGNFKEIELAKRFIDNCVSFPLPPNQPNMHPQTFFENETSEQETESNMSDKEEKNVAKMLRMLEQVIF